MFPWAHKADICHLHIGTQKTGTTSLQKLFSVNREYLADAGVLYPDCFGEPDHRRFTQIAVGDLIAADAQGPPNAMGQPSINAKEVFKRLRNETQDCRPKHIIISSEHLHSDVATAGDLQRIKDLLEPFCRKVIVYIHLRPQVDVIISLASTAARNGQRVVSAYIDEASPEKRFFDYLSLVHMWEGGFGAENVRCIAYRRRSDMAGVLCEATGVDVGALKAPDKANQSLDVRTIMLLNALAAEDGSKRLPVEILDALPVEQPLTIGLWRAQAVMGKFKTQNEAVIAHRPDLEPGDLDPDWERFPEHGNAHQLDHESPFRPVLQAVIDAYGDRLKV